MGDVHINPGLDQDKRIFRTVSFYDLIDLMTFSQMTFGRADPFRLGIQHYPHREAIGCPDDAASLRFQSWAMLGHEHAIDWWPDEPAEPSIYLISSVSALSASLIPGEGTKVFIEQTCRVIPLPGASRPEESTVLPLLEDETLLVIVNDAGNACQGDPRHNPMRLLVDLRTLLLGVVVSPKASIRFVELISQIVQRTTHAYVSRASRAIDIEHHCLDMPRMRQA